MMMSVRENLEQHPLNPGQCREKVKGGPLIGMGRVKKKAIKRYGKG